MVVQIHSDEKGVPESWEYSNVVIEAFDKDGYVLTPTTPPKENDIFENYSKISCQRLLSE